MARKSGCVRGVNLRLSQPEATMGWCGKKISSQASSVKDGGETGGVFFLHLMSFNPENRVSNYDIM